MGQGTITGQTGLQWLFYTGHLSTSYNHDLLPQLDFLYRQTVTKTSQTLCEAPGWQVTPYHILQALLPAGLCLSRTLSSRCSAMLCLLLPPGLPSTTTPPKAGGTSQFKPLWKPKSQCHVCVCVCVYRGWGNEWPWLGWGIFHTSPHPGQHGYSWELGGENHLSYSFYSFSSQVKPT